MCRRLRVDVPVPPSLINRLGNITNTVAAASFGGNRTANIAKTLFGYPHNVNVETRQFIKYFLGSILFVIATDTSMIATNNKMVEAVVL